ncbi:MAG: RluA family pseudouridine synthase [Oscillospiraceae bacterium]|nr:RluA family pseudouridine synthase [Oscillospiraceae bacterium]
MILSYTVPESGEGRKVYSILRREFDASAALVRRLKQCGGVYVDGVPAFTVRRLSPGETVTADISAAEPPCDIVPEEGCPDILYEDDGLIAVNKPAGRIVHPSRARFTGTEANYVVGYLQKNGEPPVCHAVNRIDRDTSGVVLFSKNSYMKARASRALAVTGEKEYLALVCGVPPEENGTIDMPIKRLTEGDMFRAVAPDGQRAVTHYELLGTGDSGNGTVSLLRFRLETGRTHQIRVHCLALGIPILGDILYYSDQSRELSSSLGLTAQQLHAYRLRFTEPLTGARIDLTAPVTREDMRHIIETLDFRY